MTNRKKISNSKGNEKNMFLDDFLWNLEFFFTRPFSFESIFLCRETIRISGIVLKNPKGGEGKNPIFFQKNPNYSRNFRKKKLKRFKKF